MNTRNGTSTATISFLAGMGVGAVIALLYAPKSGKETRELINRKAEEGSDYIAAKSRELRKRAEDVAEDMVEKGRRAAEELADKGKAVAAKIG